jgi:hypothetical protein
MKKNFVFVVLVLFGTILSFNSCKKGENDPFLSLSSRKARLIGEWKLTSATWTTNSVNISTEADETVTNTYIYSYNFINSQMTQTTKHNSNPEYFDVYTYNENLSILESGTYKRVNIETHDSETPENYTEEGIWYFVGGNKDLDVENKERVGFQPEKRTTVTEAGTQTSTSTGKDTYTNLILLDKLTKKEIVVTFDYSNEMIYTDGDKMSVTSKGTKTYTLQ